MILSKFAKNWRSVLYAYFHLKPTSLEDALAFYSAPLKWVSRLGRAKLWEFINRDFLLISSGFGVYITPRDGLYGFTTEEREINMVSKFMRSDSVFIDVGAYMGLYTILACRKVGRVVAVEPNPYSLTFLKANIAINGCSNVTVAGKATASRRGVVELKIPADNPFSFGSIIVWEHPASKRILVEADTLDNIIAEAGVNHVDIVKVDIERAEGLAFEGMRETLKKARFVMMEIWPENIWILKEMKHMGYKLKEIVVHGYVKNYIFVKA